MQERKRSNSANFVTLTYDDAHVPINEETMSITLDRKAIPDYMKRLRKLHYEAYKIKGYKGEKLPLKYYAVGEYGEDYERPHYHIIIFNAIADLIPLAWALNKTMFGLVDIGKKGVTAGGARYLAQYMLTGQKENNTNRIKPFSLMSKNLGLNYITEEIKKWHLQKTGTPIVMPNGKIMETRDRYYAIQDGYKIALPRYYRDKIFPKIYRDIDVPLISDKHMIEEYKIAEKDFEGYQRNKAGIVATNESIMLKKIKAKQRNAFGEK